jgi:hypothetical protein
MDMTSASRSRQDNSASEFGGKIFKEMPPATILYDLLDKISLKKPKYYVLDINAYNKLKYNKTTWYEEFTKSLKPYYFISKHYYLDRPLTYNHFITVIRQLCKANNLEFSKKISYSKHDYNSDYYIYYV